MLVNTVDTFDRDNLMVVAEDEELLDDKVYLTEAEKEVYAKDMSLIYFVVNKFQNTKVDPDELVSVGAVGFANALNTFDTRQQVKFTTYAVSCIRNEILHLLRKERNTISRDISMETVLSKNKYGDIVTIGKLLCVEESGRDKMDSKVELALDIERLSSVMQNLNKVERFIIQNRFGLGGRFVYTQDEIADEVGMTQGNVSKIERRALVKLKRELIREFGMTEEVYKSKIENISILLEKSHFVGRRWRYVNGRNSNE
ncbi:sigma-70 family RNA polymerase sigma factor [Lysinibacillus sphaericus]|uniref:sigma-70 family RNA polymerase sigma factor n=1 Tax=Lysinibacillus sphaericus TaxID=1421 RepID=UPI0018CE12D9|nr:sigma-70 family RNA polymerase sigma factor [Lysinibacillus sphaericus]